jgi:hypothetical protein
MEHPLHKYKNTKQRLLSSSTDEVRQIARAATALFEGFIMPQRFTGGCYLTTIFLYLYLKREHGIETKPVVGYVNDGTDDIMISHAWLEYEDLKTDITLFLVENPQIQSQGPLLVLNEQLLPGDVIYTYHLTRPPEAIAALEHMHPWVVAQKEYEHEKMLSIISDELRMNEYIAKAPVKVGYEAMKSGIEIAIQADF